MLAEWALQHGIRFAYASSAATYGALEGRLSDRMDIRTLRPLNMYGYSKQLFDLHASARGYLDRIIGLKYFNVFGPNEDHKGDMRSVVNKAFGQIVETGRVRLFKSHRPEFADGEQRRDFLYVKDAVEMTLDLVAEPGANGLFNIGSGKSHTWRELVTAVFGALGRPVDIEFIEMPVELRAKYQYATEASIERLHEAGYRRPITPLADAVRDYVTQYLVPAQAPRRRAAGLTMSVRLRAQDQGSGKSIEISKILPEPGDLSPEPMVRVFRGSESPADSCRDAEVALFLIHRWLAIEALEGVDAPIQVPDDVALEAGVHLEPDAGVAVERVVGVGGSAEIRRSAVEGEPFPGSSRDGFGHILIAFARVLLACEGNAGQRRYQRAVGLREDATRADANERPQVQRQLFVLLKLQKPERRPPWAEETP